jgi:hypothetical protein
LNMVKLVHRSGQLDTATKTGILYEINGEMQVLNFRYGQKEAPFSADLDKKQRLLFLLCNSLLEGIPGIRRGNN